MAVATSEDGELSGVLAGRYRVAGRLGSGGMGVVYEAHDEVLDRRVALKTLPSAGEADPAARTRLLDEARAAARINHPHVVTVYDALSCGPVDFLVMELLPLGSLAQGLATRGPLAWRLATRLAAQACEGLAAAHRAGIVHRDIKPSNLMLVGTAEDLGDGGWPAGERLAVKIADFGISRSYLATATHSGATWAPGTVHFMSPEQCEGSADERSDLYSLGATYYALLTGEPPFAADHPLQVMFRHWSSPVPDPSATREDIPADCGAIIRRAMAKQPRERYASASAMQRDLERLAAGEAVGDRERSEVGGQRSEVGGKKSDDRGRRNAKAWGIRIAAIAACLCVLLAAWRTWESRNGRRAEAPREPTAGDAIYNVSAVLPGGSSRVGAPLAWRPGFRKLPGELMGAALSRDGRYLACALSSGGGMALDLAADEYSRELTSPDSAASVAAVAFAGDPPYVVAGMGDLVQMHSIPTGRYDRLQKLDRGRVTSVAVAPRGDRLAVGGDLGEEKSGCIWLHRLSREGSVWHASDTRVLANPYETAIRFVSFSPEGDLLVSYDDKGALVIYDTEQAAPVRMLNMPEPYVRSHAPRSAAFSPDSRQLAAAGDRRVILWDVVTWRERPFEELHTSPITCLAWSRDGQWVVSASADGLAVWEAASGRACGPLQPLDGASDVRTLLFLGDGEWLLSGASDKRFLLWNWRQVGPLARQQEAELRR